MARYILIDANSGYIFADTGDLNGPARDETPADAARRTDEEIGNNDLEYTELTGGQSSRGKTGYYVYRADIDGREVVPLVENGQDQDTIDEVESKCEYVCFVETICE